MMDFVATFQHWLTLACFVALAVCLFALAVLCAIPELTDAIRRFCGMDNFGKVVCGVCIVGAVLYGGSKGVNVRWDDGLRDNGTLITNDTVAVRWTYSGIPGASSVFIAYREAGTTNDWLNLAETLASAQEWTGTLANATNYDYWVYSTYVPPVPVHTNGVWVGQAYETKAKVGAAAFLILNGKVVADGRTIAPPTWAEPSGPSTRDYIQDGLVAMWDAIENAGRGVHDANATKWVDLSGQAFDFDVPNTLSWSDDALVFPPNGDKNTNRLYTNHSFTQNKTIEVVAKFTTNSSSILRANTSGHTLVFHWSFTLFWNGTNRGSGNLSAGQRHYAALCIDDANGYRIYRDTANVYRKTSVVLSPLNETVFTVGYYPNSTYAFYGDVCAIRFYNRPLTEEEIQHNRNIDKRRFNLP